MSEDSFKPKPMGKRYAPCREHLRSAFFFMQDITMVARNVSADDDRYYCHCGKHADYYFMEVEPK